MRERSVHFKQLPSALKVGLINLLLSSWRRIRRSLLNGTLLFTESVDL